MAEGKRRHDWEATSALMAIVTNLGRKKGEAVPLDYFTPFKVRTAPKTIPAPITVLRDVFVDRKVPKT